MLMYTCDHLLTNIADPHQRLPSQTRPLSTTGVFLIFRVFPITGVFLRTSKTKQAQSERRGGEMEKWRKRSQSTKITQEINNCLTQIKHWHRRHLRSLNACAHPPDIRTFNRPVANPRRHTPTRSSWVDADLVNNRHHSASYCSTG